MNTLEVCEALYDGSLTSQQAYDTLTPMMNRRGVKRAFFIKMRITLPNESKRLNAFLRILFAIPLPIGLVRFGLRFAPIDEQFKKNQIEGLSKDDLSALLKYARGTKIKIESEDAIIRIVIK
ncbi:MAG: hypothetical protein ACLFRI_03860 [Candidatus Izemoplasmataceae bacterium]